MHKLKQKILALFLAAVMCIPITGSFSVEAGASDGERLMPHTHKICAGSDCVDAAHSDITWTEWESADSMPTVAGSYYLTEDVTISASWQPPEGVVNLCLNGHTLKSTDTSDDGKVIQVSSDTELNICDCSADKSGTITGSTPNGITFMAKLGGGASSCTMYGGTITGIDYTNPDVYTGAAVNITDTNASFYMRGGSIKGNGALGVDTGAGSFYILGTVDISGNGTSYAVMMNAMSGQLEQAGIDLGNINRYIDISVIKDANIIHLDGPVIMKNKSSVFMPAQDMSFCGTFTDGYDASMAGKRPSDYFYSAASAFEVAYENNEAVLRRRTVHSHDMSVDCGDENPVVFGGALTSKDGRLCIDGSEIEATEENGDRFFALPEGSYYLEDNVSVECLVVITGKADICLNGKTLDTGENGIFIKDTASLNLCDCGNGGKITGIRSGADNLSSVIWSSGEFSMYGGRVVNTSEDILKSKHHAVGAFGGKIKFYGGEVASLNDEAVYVDDGSSMTLSGEPVIRGGDGFADIYLDNEYADSPVINIDAPLTGASYSVSIYRECEFTSGWDTHMADAEISQHFTCAGKGFFINKNERGELEFVKYVITEQPSKDNGYKVTVTGEPDSYQWYEVSADETPVSGQNNASFTGTEPGRYICKITYGDGTVLTSEEAEYLLPAHIHTLVHYGKVLPTCTGAGTGEYWKCEGDEGCGAFFADKDAVTEISGVPAGEDATGHAYGNWTIKTEPDLDSKGTAERVCANDAAHKETAELPPLSDTTFWTYNVITKPSGDSEGLAEYISEYGAVKVVLPADKKDSTLSVEVEKKENVPDTSIVTPENKLADIVLTDEEKQVLADGTDIKIRLIVEDAGDKVSVEDKDVVNSCLDGWKIGQYLDISLFKDIGSDTVKITSPLKQTIQITVAVPDNIKNTDKDRTRKFAVIRVHDGAVTVLEDTDDFEDTITVETDRFSTYVIVYKDSPEHEDKPDDGNKPGDNESPSTGDGPAKIYATLGMIAGLAYLLSHLAKRRRAMTE